MELPILFNFDPTKPIGRCFSDGDRLLMEFPEGVDADMIDAVFGFGSAWRVTQYELRQGRVFVLCLEVSHFGLMP